MVRIGILFFLSCLSCHPAISLKKVLSIFFRRSVPARIADQLPALSPSVIRKTLF